MPRLGLMLNTDKGRTPLYSHLCVEKLPSTLVYAVLTVPTRPFLPCPILLVAVELLGTGRAGTQNGMAHNDSLRQTLHLGCVLHYYQSGRALISTGRENRQAL